MNSPEPLSPTNSTPSSGSPPPEEINFQQPSSTTGYLSNLAGQLSTAFGRGSGSSSKRRFPAGGSFGVGGSDRDPKTRKKTGESGRMGSQYDGLRESKKEREDLIDTSTVDWLRKGQILDLMSFPKLIQSRNWRSFPRTWCEVLIIPAVSHGVLHSVRPS